MDNACKESSQHSIQYSSKQHESTSKGVVLYNEISIFMLHNGFKSILNYIYQAFIFNFQRDHLSGVRYENVQRVL